MKVAIIGNLAGTANEILLGLRRVGVQADLFVSPHDMAAMFHDLDGQPEYRSEWVHCFDTCTPSSASTSRTFLQLLNAVITQRARTARALLSYDVIHSHTCTLNFSILGYLFYVRMKLRPYLAFATGSDFRELAHHGPWPFSKMARDFFCRADKTFLLNADMVAIKDQVDSRASFFPFVVDEKKYSPRVIERPAEHSGKLICYMMSNLDFGKADGNNGRRGIKANDRFLFALNDFRKIDPLIHAVITYRGPDRIEAERLVHELNLEDYVTFVLPSKELGRIEQIARADVVIDQFTAGSFGLGAIQIMSMGKPLITYFNNEFAPQSYGRPPPVLNASSREEILEALLLARDPKVRAAIGERSRSWVLENHASNMVIPRLLKHYDKLIKQKKNT